MVNSSTLLIKSTGKDRLDYVDDYQDLYTSSETLDIELFQIPSVGLFAAMAHKATKPGSAIYRWDGAHFQLYQNISTFKAQAWKQFTIGGKVRSLGYLKQDHISWHEITTGMESIF